MKKKCQSLIVYIASTHCEYLKLQIFTSIIPPFNHKLLLFQLSYCPTLLFIFDASGPLILPTDNIKTSIRSQSIVRYFIYSS